MTRARILLLGGLAGLCVLRGVTVIAAPPVASMYVDTMAREKAIRVALADPDAPLKLEEVRAVVRAYEAIVAQYPASGYSDNALWQAGHLALDAFWRFGQAQDKDTCVRLLQRLVVAYPTSKLTKQVPAELRQAAVAGPRAATATVPAPEPSPATASGTDARVAPPRPASGSIATIRDIRRSVLPDAVRVTIELDGEVPFRDERIPDPSRVFLDLPGTRPAAALLDRTLRFESDADIVRQVRLGRHPNNTTRVVLDADGVTSYSVYPLYNPYRLVIDCVRGKAVETAGVRGKTVETAAASLAARHVAIWLRSAPAVTPQHSVIITAARSSVVDVVAPPPPPLPPSVPILATTTASIVPAAMAPPPVDPPARNVAGGLSMARQLGLGVSRIVIDAGHGGHDPGAKGKGVTEAELVLDVALRLEKLLQKVPGVDVILTRRTDDFIPLPERTAIANREGADLFLSIHANASSSTQAHGIETYFLNFANNQSEAAVAARENATSAQAMGALPDFVKAIALHNKRDESRDFATQVQRAMIERLSASNRTLRDLGVKQAPFVVLIGAVMPSVLAEVSFVTNPQEARLLKGNVYRQRIAEALFNAIRKYQTSLKGATSVASQ
ncbi:MAG TPA: N-acetylmuramoyl-L-alanine amidase [Vicinamibacterales bacterium]|jgi:N-acetylmuramoyl-L-alanine amidase|nr:N-acetylmuramoyl-L-alanine amidase [Vicinamibacterales bacterium]